MKQKEKFDPMLLICAVMVIVVLAISVVISVKIADPASKSSNYLAFGGGWLSEDGDAVSLDGFPESCIIHKEIPQLERDMDLIFNSRNIDVNVYVDGDCIYRTKKPSDPFVRTIYGKTAGSEFVEVDILQRYSGKTLYIEIVNPYKANGTSNKIVDMYLGDGGYIVKHNTAVQLGAFCFSALILFIGVVCLVLYIPLRRSNMMDRSLLYLGLTSFAFGMLMITDSKLLHLVVGYETLFYTTSQMLMTVIPIPMLLFFDRLYGNLNKKIIYAICCLGALEFVAAFILNACNIKDYFESAVYMLLVYVCVISYVGFITVRQLFRRDKGNLFHDIGVLFIIVMSVLDIVVVRYTYFVETSFFTKIGIAGFIILECVQVLSKHMANYQKGIKAQVVSRLAYHDGLTDMLNRTSFMEDREALEKERPDNLLFAVFDINDLKYVNDNFGHPDDDEMIINVADSLRQAFDGVGKCYRTGGDEFVLIATCEEPVEKYNTALGTLKELLRAVDKRSKYPVSIAAGYALMDENTESLRALIRQADEDMYRNKRKMKKQVAS